MYGDFSRNPFCKADRVTRVLFNQGQPLVEADLNEAINAVIENAKYTCESVAKPEFKVNGNSITLTGGTLKTPIGGFRVDCPIELQIEGCVEGAESLYLVASQHPFSLAYLKERLQSEETIHSAEIWGLRLSLRKDKPPCDKSVNATVSIDKNACLPPNSLIRIEFDHCDGEKRYFKLDINNGGYANFVDKGDASLCLKGNVCLMRPLVADEFVELQSPVGDHVITGMSLIAAIKCVSGKTINLVDGAKNNLKAVCERGLQCRIWTDYQPLVVKDGNSHINFCNHSVRDLTFKLCKDSLSQLQPGMYWLFNSDKLILQQSKANDQEHKKELCVSSEGPQAEYCIGTVACSGAAAASAPSVSPTSVEPAPAPLEDMTLTPTSSAFDLNAVPTTNLAIGLESPQLRRWLASMTLGELSNLDHNAIRSRVTRDCNIKLQADPTIDRDIGLIVDKRDRLLSQRGQYVV